MRTGKRWYSLNESFPQKRGEKMSATVNCLGSFGNLTRHNNTQHHPPRRPRAQISCFLTYLTSGQILLQIWFRCLELGIYLVKQNLESITEIHVFVFGIKFTAYKSCLGIVGKNHQLHTCQHHGTFRFVFLSYCWYFLMIKYREWITLDPALTPRLTKPHEIPLLINRILPDPKVKYISWPVEPSVIWPECSEWRTTL